MTDFIAEIKQKVAKAQQGESARIELSLIDRVRGLKGSLGRLIASGIKNPDSYCSAEIAMEKEVCCSICRPEGNCPYCGCAIGIKKYLATEPSCPSPDTYPHLKVFPPRDYWQVCQDTTSVIIAARNEPHINKTITSLLENATGSVEVIVVLDGQDYPVLTDPRVRVIKFSPSKGTRPAYNMGASVAVGKYLLILDAHCTYSFGWDTKLKCACFERSLVVSLIKPLDEQTWEVQEDQGCYSFVYLNKELQEKWWSGHKPAEQWHILEPTMSFTGCGWMIRKQYFQQLGGFDIPELGEYGYIGPEFTLKVWLHEQYPGQIVLRTDVVCGHLFSTNTGGKLYRATTMPHKQYYELMMRRWATRLPALLERFAPVPTWNAQPPPKKSLATVKSRQISVEKEVKTIVSDQKGNIISRNIVQYETVSTNDDGTGDVNQIAKQLAGRAKPIEQ